MRYCYKGMIKGLTVLDITLPQPSVLLAAGTLGFLSYGLSLVLFVVALRHLGTARTSAYFSTAPFVGALLALPLLGESLSIQFVVAALFMAVGVWLHLTERHEHWHIHEELEHEHVHIHDNHHQHEHSEAVIGAHTHWHRHKPVAHSHPHYPDAHHRHEHE